MLGYNYLDTFPDDGGPDYILWDDGTIEPPSIAKPLPKLTGQRKKGRPLAKDKGKTLAATKPWEDLGMSRATWFNRQAKDKDSKL